MISLKYLVKFQIGLIGTDSCICGAINSGVPEKSINKTNPSDQMTGGRNKNQNQIAQNSEQVNDLNSEYVPITLLANDLVLSVARPRSPILTEPLVPVMKILSHLNEKRKTISFEILLNFRFQASVIAISVIQVSYPKLKKKKN